MAPKRKYKPFGIEAKYIGQTIGSPWKNWKLFKRFETKEERDNMLAILKRNKKYTLWRFQRLRGRPPKPPTRGVIKLTPVSDMKVQVVDRGDPR